MSLLFYRRPDFVAKLPGPMDKTQCQIYVDRTQKHKKAIPPELSFDNILQNKALPPCALQDFMDYLVYISHDAENLQFWIWLNAYTTRFYALPPSDQALSPPWSAVEGLQPTGNDPSRPPKTARKSQFGAEIDFDHPSIVPNAVQSPPFDKQSFISGTANTAKSTADSVEDANAQVGLKWQSFSVQPYRSEIDRVISHYIAPDSPRELNISHKTRTVVLHALQHTTHPSAFSPVRDLVEGTLRGQSHPNFVRWSICNGNKPKVLFVRNAGIAHVVLAIFLAVVLILSKASRWWRLFCFPLFFLGFSVGVAAYKGLCLVIHTGHSRNLRPWEQFGDSASLDSFDNNNEAGLSTDDVYSMSNRSSGGKRGMSMDTFGTGNSFDHEPWVERYKKKPFLQRVYPKNIGIQDETIRILQDRIVWQSHLWSLLASVPLTVAIIAVPRLGVW
ncbi:MAG: hypothetical protein L6R42_000739 [Xanthoria sp. 1 TBL-2021]|nr:MAG: hypothetical protein L6R42_000739 [Xanthoria sp. 1 TBL-2021]